MAGPCHTADKEKNLNEELPLPEFLFFPLL